MLKRAQPASDEEGYHSQHVMLQSEMGVEQVMKVKGNILRQPTVTYRGGTVSRLVFYVPISCVLSLTPFHLRSPLTA